MGTNLLDGADRKCLKQNKAFLFGATMIFSKHIFPSSVM